MIKLWDLTTGKEQLTCKAHGDVVRSLAFSPSGKTLASGSRDATIKLWNMPAGRKLATLQSHAGGIWSLAFSPDGKTLVSGSMDRTIKLWEIKERGE